ncbi:hypothetical protein NLJ89_g1948 [Agrocybe chaxingu]|uniref:Uncharacterized protein n=1 Tax=Agrocybe chaxingu TaxID=84603 RepID=A0A9W8TDG1_9AGAR|nr:hypothetical protein NLJ89_g1948 [Agrocybe chaxingu]
MSNDPCKESTPEMDDYYFLNAYDHSESSEEELQSGEEEETELFDLYAQRGTSVSPSPSLSTDYGDESSEARVTAAEYETDDNESEDIATPTTAHPKRTVHFKTPVEDVVPEDDVFLEEDGHRLCERAAVLHPEHPPQAAHGRNAGECA